MKHFYLLLALLSSIFTTSYAINSPVLLSPQANSTVTISSLSGFETNANESTARKLTIKVMLNDPRTLVYQNSATFATATEATTPVPFLFSGSNPLKAGQQYLVELKTESANGSLLKQQYFTFFTSGQTVGEPLLVKPAVNDTVYLRSAYLNYDGTTMTVNANEPRATRIAINVFHAITGEQVNYQREGAPTAKGFATSAEATQNTELSMFIANLHHEKIYPAKVFLSTYASGGALLAQKEFNVFIKPRPSVDSVYAVFTNPTEGQTGVSLQPTIAVRESEEIEKHGMRFIITSYELDRYPADWQGDDYQKLVFNGGGTSLEKSWKPANVLKPGTKYQVQVSYTILDGSRYATKKALLEFTTAPVSSKPLLISPKPDSVTALINSGVFYTPMLTYTANANNPDARFMDVRILNKNTGARIDFVRGGPIGEFGFSTSQAAISNVERSVYIDIPAPTHVFEALVVMKTYDSGHTQLTEAVYPIKLLPRPSSNDVHLTFLSPTNGQSNVPLPVVVKIKEPDTAPFNDIDFFYGDYEVDRYPADWQGDDYRRKNITTNFPQGVMPTWQIDSLQPATTYQVRLHYNVFGTADAAPVVTKDTSITFTTAPFAVSKPLLVSPKPDSILYLVNALYREQASWTVNANDSRARSITAQIFDHASGVEVSYLYDRSLPIQVSLSAATATQNVQMGSFVNPLNHVAYPARIVLTTKDSLGNVIGQGEYNLTVKPRPLAQDVNLTIVAPVNGQSNVTLPVAVQVQRPDNIAVHGVSIEIGLYSIDRYPADWQGEDYQQQRVPLSASSWQIPNLKPNTTYELSIVYIVGGAAEANVSGLAKTVKTVFTTAPAPNSNQLLLWPANNQTVSVCDSSDVLVSANNKNARKLVVKLLRNDPRVLVQEYAYTFADSTAALQTIHIANVFGQLTANEQYLFEVKALDAWGGLLKQQYYTLFTSSCSSSSARMALQGAEIPQQSSISPNPSTSDFQLRLHNGYDKATVEVVSMEGRVINQYKVAGSSQVSIKGNGLKPGLYLIRITGNAGLSEQFKIVKQ